MIRFLDQKNESRPHPRRTIWRCDHHWPSPMKFISQTIRRDSRWSNKKRSSCIKIQFASSNEAGSWLNSTKALVFAHGARWSWTKKGNFLCHVAPDSQICKRFRRKFPTPSHSLAFALTARLEQPPHRTSEATRQSTLPSFYIVFTVVELSMSSKSSFHRHDVDLQTQRHCAFYYLSAPPPTCVRNTQKRYEC